MECPDRMGALSYRRRRENFESRTRLISPGPDNSEFGQRNKRSRLQQEESSFSLPSSTEESGLCRSESKTKTKPNFNLPPPSPLKRAVQGLHRRTDFLKTRVSTLSVLDKQLEQECTMGERCYDTSNLESADLPGEFAYTNGNHRGGDSTEVVIQDESVGVDSDRIGITIEDERVEVGTYSGGIENGGEGIAIDNGRPSFTPVVVHDVEMNSERDSETERVTKKSKPTGKVELLHNRIREEIANERDLKLEYLCMEIALASARFEALQLAKAKYKKKQDGNEILIEPEKEVGATAELAATVTVAQGGVAVGGASRQVAIDPQAAFRQPQAQITQLTTERDNLQMQLTARDAQLAVVTQECDALQSKQDQLRRERDAQDNTIEGLNARIQALQSMTVSPSARAPTPTLGLGERSVALSQYQELVAELQYYRGLVEAHLPDQPRYGAHVRATAGSTRSGSRSRATASRAPPSQGTRAQDPPPEEKMDDTGSTGGL